MILVSREDRNHPEGCLQIGRHGRGRGMTVRKSADPTAIVRNPVVVNKEKSRDGVGCNRSYPKYPQYG